MESQLLNHIKSSHNWSDVSEETEKVCNASIRMDYRKTLNVCENNGTYLSAPKRMTHHESGYQSQCNDQIKEQYNNEQTIPKLLNCKECGERFINKYKLYKYLNGVHKTIKPHMCPEPGCHYRTAYRNQMTLHLKDHYGLREIYTCHWPECDFATVYGNSLRQHINTHTDERPYECQLLGCGMKFRSRQQLWHHKRYQCQYTMEKIVNLVNPEVSDNHNVRDDQQMDQSLQCMSETTSFNDTNIAEKSPSNPEFVCFSNGCNQKFPLASLLLKHIKSSHSGTNVSEETANKVYATRPCQMSDEPITLMNYQDYGNAYSYTEPVTSHESGCRMKSYDCPECGQPFNCNSNLQEHMNSVHNNIKPHVCPEPGCKFRSAYRRNLNAHLKNHDGLEERFSCEWPECNFTTIHKRSLQHHILIHTNEKPYECQHSGCGMKFRTEGALKQHTECHSEYNNYICDAGLRYRTSQSLSKHKIRYCRYKLENVLNQSVVNPEVSDNYWIDYNQQSNEYSDCINEITYYNEMNIPDHSYSEPIFWTSYGSMPRNHVMPSHNGSNFSEDTTNIFNICENGQGEKLKTFIGKNSGNSTLHDKPTTCLESGSIFNRNDPMKDHSYTNRSIARDKNLSTITSQQNCY